MSIRTVTASSPLKRSPMDATILQLHRARHEVQRTVVIVGLAAGALGANIAGAAASNHHRYSGASTPNSAWVGFYAASNHERYDRAPRAGHGAFEEKERAP